MLIAISILNWYATKAEAHKVVPTWNYMVVHAYGKLILIDDVKEIRQQLIAMVNEQEQNFSQPWQLINALEEYIQRQIKGIVVIKLTITTLLAKWKISQNQTVKNQQSVIHGLTSSADDSSKLMAEQVASKLKT